MPSTNMLRLSAPYEMIGWDLWHNGFHISIRVNGFHFTIPVWPSCFVNSPTAMKRFSENFDKITAGEDDKSGFGAYREHIADVFIPEFEKLAPQRHHTGKLTLFDLADRGFFECDYRVVEEVAVAGAVTEHSLEDLPLFEACDMRALQSIFPLFDPADVEVPYSDGSGVYGVVPHQRKPSSIQVLLVAI